MAERKSEWSATDLRYAWHNSGGTVNYLGAPKGKVECPYKDCQAPNIWINASAYGNDSKWHWVVDHKVPLSKGGTNNPSNLQAMHNYCNTLKGASRT